MAIFHRNYIDKHWSLFLIRGALSILFSCLVIFTGSSDIESVVALLCVFLLTVGAVDAVGALYSSLNKRGWVTSVLGSLIDVIAAIALLFYATDITSYVVIISLYTVISGIVDIFHGFVSTVDPTDRFIRVLAGICGCVIGLTILNSGGLEITTFVRFFGIYMLIMGTTGLIYGVHNREQMIEDKESDAKPNKKTATKKVAAKKSTSTKKSTSNKKNTSSRSKKK